VEVYLLTNKEYSTTMDKEPLLGCKAYELEVGTEFSYDEGRSWVVVMTEPRYATDTLISDDLIFMVGASGSGPGKWHEVRLNESEHVLLERNWRSQ
jgi:hypothetical protein